MRLATSTLLALLAAAALAAVVACRDRPPDPEPPVDPTVTLFQGLGDHHRPITTDVPLAQRYFDQGLVLTYGFNHDAAVRAFEEAARLDPRCAMCVWGIALALGPNINAPMGPEAGARAWREVQRARARAEHASPRERAYIEALAARYSDDPGADRAALDRAYADAMGALHRADPADVDAATLYAEALMDLRPWQLYDKEGHPAPDTPEIERVLEAVMEADPDHPGANHYYIHAVEASYTPERALPAAERLDGLAPEAGHLVHMPSHIFWRVGMYERAEDINQRAAASDEAFFARCGARGIYAAAYYPHNVHFLWAAASEQGRAALALSSARKLAAQIPDTLVADFPFVEQFRPIPVQTLARFGRWDAVLGEPEPPAAHLYSRGVWHAARGLARVRRGEPGLAAQELAALRAIAARDEVAAQDLTGEPASRYLALAEAQLAGELAAARGDTDAAVAALERGLAVQDAMVYTEPPRWHMSLRQNLGAILLEAGRPAEAEAVYREDLRRLPNSGWSLFGLAAALRAQGRDAEAGIVGEGFAQAFARADVELHASRF